LRDCIRPFDGSAEKGKQNRGNGTNNWQPSREHSIEELPIALGFLVIATGDFEKSIFGASNYGRDNDSTAGMVGAIAGALNGTGVIRDEWMQKINEANRVDLVPLADELCELKMKLFQDQVDSLKNQKRDFETLKNIKDDNK
jgi:ADP-ribosylglycohydrolase